jgi:hypothetical protein
MSTDDEQHRGATAAHPVGSHDTYGTHVEQRTTIPRPDDEQFVYRADADTDVVGAHRKGFDLPATLGGALAALGTLLLLSSVVSAAVGAVGYQTGVEGRDLSVAGLVGGLLSLFLACLVGGWVAGRMARRKGGVHGLIAALWLVLLAALLAGLAALAGDRFDVTERVGLPNWFDADALAPLAIGTGLLALALMLLGGWLGGRWGQRHHSGSTVDVVQTRRAVTERSGGIRAAGEGR